MDESVPYTGELRPLLDSDSLRDWMTQQRWYASKSHGLSGIEVLEVATLRPNLHLVLVHTRLTTGAHEIYQLLLATQSSSQSADGRGEAVASTAELSAYDALGDPDSALVLMEKIREDADVHATDGCFAFRHLDGAHRPAGASSVRSMNAQQSNSTVVIDDQVALKVFRRVESGINPELEMLRFLTYRGFEHIAQLQGWYEYEGVSLASTLGIAQTYIGESQDGWQLALDEIVSAPDTLLGRLHELGQVTAQMHTTLASDASDPAFSPEDPNNESMAILAASVDEEIERIFMRLPDTEALAPIYGRGDDVRAKLATRSHIGAGGKLIRIHGDYHLGQTLQTPKGWVILDFEGEPGRPLPERRQKRSPLRDVAGMLRSLAYLSSALTLQRGQEAPEDFEVHARGTFLDGYMDAVDPALLPAGEAPIMNLVSIFELEKAVYELRYELNNRPDWVAIPVAGIRRLMEET